MTMGRWCTQTYKNQAAAVSQAVPISRRGGKLKVALPRNKNTTGSAGQGQGFTDWLRMPRARARRGSPARERTPE